MASLRACCAGLRELSVAFRQDQKAEAEARKAATRKKAEAQAAKAGGGAGINDTEAGLDAVAEDGSDVGYVEFLPVEWFEQVWCFFFFHSTRDETVQLREYDDQNWNFI